MMIIIFVIINTMIITVIIICNRIVLISQLHCCMSTIFVRLDTKLNKE